MAIPWGPILTFGSSLLGGIFGKKKAPQPQVTTTESVVDYKKMVANAEAAGFNPLTALRNGGASGFTTTTGTTTGGPAMSSSGGGFGRAVGQALADGLGAMATYDPMKVRMDQATYDLVQAQIGRVEAMTDAERRSNTMFNVPSRTGGQAVSGITPASRPVGVAGDFEAGDVTVTNPIHKRFGWEANPYLADAEAWEQRIGDSEVASMAVGAANVAGDIYWNMYAKSDDTVVKKAIERDKAMIRAATAPLTRRPNDISIYAPRSGPAMPRFGEGSW